MRSAHLRLFSLLLSLLCCVSPIQGAGIAPSANHEFIFARLVYNSNNYEGWSKWQADWPEAETHFAQGLHRFTHIDVSPEGVLLQLDDDQVFDYPWLYVVEVGSLTLSREEATRLREYLLRGGFLMVDDFHGGYEWAMFQQVMMQVFPDRPIVELPDETEAFHVLYNLSEREQIPGVRALMSGRTWEKDGRNASWRGILDDRGRVMVAINFNQDIGDAWEHADDAIYPERYSAMAYRLGVNYVIYAMTH